MEDILKHVLKNIVDFGKVNPKFIMGMVLKQNPERKKDIPSLLSEIDKIIESNKLSKEEAKKKLTEIAPEMLEEKKEEKGLLKPLPGAEIGKVKLRIAPSPSGPLHIGHAYGASLNSEYAKMYKGKLILRIEDTNPDKIYLPAYEMQSDESNWLTEDNISEVVIQSSRLGIYYDYAEKLVDMENAYVCTCDPDKWREMKNKGESCPCRTLDKKENSLRYAKMFNGYAEGEAVLRLKTDLKNKNPAMRDFSIMRINEKIHPKTGKEQRMWPLMVLSVAIDDHELGITHVLNGKDQTDNSAKEKLIMDCFGWTHPYYQHWGKINFIGMKLKSTEIKIAIEQGEYSGWDDIRLPFLEALRRRGYQPAAIRKFATEIGLSLNDKKVSKEEFWKSVNAFNKDVIEPIANRYFFVSDPIEIKVEGMPKKEVALELHPDFDRGKRNFKVDGNFIISKQDKLEEGRIHRLMDCCNFEINKGKYTFISEDYEDYKNASKKGKIIHWLTKDNVKVKVLMENNEFVEGLAEKNSIKKGEVIQFERFAFCRMDKKDEFWYLHK